MDPIDRIARGAAALVVVAGAVAALAVSTVLPGLASRYYLMLPGAAFPIAARVVVPPERKHEAGDLSFTVVYEQSVDLASALAAAGRHGVRVVPYEEVIPRGTTEEESVVQYRRAMNESHLTAAAVGLRAAGFPVKIVGRGVRVVGAIEGLPARGVLQRGDVIVAHNGTPIGTVQELTDANRRLRPGDEVTLNVRRGDQERIVTLVTAQAPNEPERAVIGINVETEGFDTELPFPVTIEERVAGGPSAGLMFALGIYDAVTPGRLADGHRVAGTGTLDREGRVGPVDGVRQKLLGTQAAGYDVFVLPAGNMREAREAGTAMKLIPVRSFDEALAALLALA
jgi:PDZ domain-containing protein